MINLEIFSRHDCIEREFYKDQHRETSTSLPISSTSSPKPCPFSTKTLHHRRFGYGRNFCAEIDLSSLGSVTAAPASDTGRSREHLQRSIHGGLRSLHQRGSTSPASAVIHYACIASVAVWTSPSPATQCAAVRGPSSLSRRLT
ncbi:hypothetical protein QJS04_geneDACA017559 [Acorus gramineus]|uniref:Uncharacterized protein n=1 Tax=Acorus gramineus TaxID=55184 RepID=A0AAV9BLS5_ACOGR|nr:hypothetical protein QJS04_geneDACA017559 [Acorus gramineus]